MSTPPRPAAPRAAPPLLAAGTWPSYRDRMIATGQMTAPVHWAGLATPLKREPGVFIVADRVAGAEDVLDIGHADDLRSHFADARRVARWLGRAAGDVVVYTIPNTAVLAPFTDPSPDGEAVPAGQR